MRTRPYGHRSRRLASNVFFHALPVLFRILSFHGRQVGMRIDEENRRRETDHSSCDNLGMFGRRERSADLILSDSSGSSGIASMFRS